MKIFKIKLPDIILAISFISILSLSNCGQNDKSKKAEVVSEPVKNEVETPAVVTDSQVAVPVNPVNIEKPVITQPEIKTEPKKETMPAANTKVPEPVKSQQLYNLWLPKINLLPIPM